MANGGVKGHACKGLAEFEAAGLMQCVPYIDENGQVCGCDDSNPVLITHCPFCGTKLEGDDA